MGLLGTQRRLDLPLLIVLRMGLFSYNGVLAPLLPAMSHTLHMSLAATAQIAAAGPLAWGCGAVFLTPLVGRFSSKRLMVGGALLMAAFSVLSGMTASYVVLLAFRLLGGLAGGATGPTSQVYLMERYEGQAQTSAIGWVAAGYAAGGLVMVPALVLLAAAVGWQGAVVAVGAFFVLISWALARALTAVPQHKLAVVVPRAYHGALVRVFRAPGALGALIANCLERAANQSVVTFLPVMLLLRYHLTYTQVAPILSAFSGAAVVGSLVGGSWPRGLAGERRSRRAYFWGLLPAMLFIALVFAPLGATWIIVAISVAYALTDAYVRPIYLKLIGTITAPRSTLGWNALGNQLGSMLGTSAPSLLIEGLGFGSLGGWGAALTAAAAVTMLRPGVAVAPRAE